MALYKYASVLMTSNSDAFDKVSSPGVRALYSGIYRCEGCGHEIASNAQNPLPPQNHHQHTTAQGSVRWKLIVYAQTS
jgi:ribosomal protein L37AE/L43A